MEPTSTPSPTKGSANVTAGASAGSRRSGAGKRPKHARKWLKRLEAKRLLKEYCRSNPSGSKLLRRWYETWSGEKKVSYEVARDHYANRVEPQFRAGESSRRIAQVLGARA